MCTWCPETDVVQCIRACVSMRRSSDALSVTLRARAYPVLTANDFSRPGLHEDSRLSAEIEVAWLRCAGHLAPK